MARQNLDAWIPEERGSEVLQVVSSKSAVEAVARRENMTSNFLKVFRAGGVEVNVTRKGEADTESDTADGEVLLEAKKFTGMLSIAEEDIDDIPENIVALRQAAWANTYAKKIDNAVLGTTGAATTADDSIPFNSVYHTLSAADAEFGYTAGQNIVKADGRVTYADISSVIGLLEESDHFEDLVILAHPSFKAVLRDLRDDNGNAVYLSGVNNTPDTVFGYPVVYTAGAKTSAVATSKPEGNPLMIVANRDYLIFGARGTVETAVVDGFNSQNVTDTVRLKMRARRAFALGSPLAAAALEVTSA